MSDPPDPAAQVSPTLPIKAKKRRLYLRFPLIKWSLLIAGCALMGFAGFFSQVVRYAPGSEGNADAIIVLTGGSERMREAIELLEQKRGKKLLISGVNTATSAEQLKHILPGHNAQFSCCITLDYQALNTLGNAEQTKRFMNDNGYQSLILVTARYHMPRAIIEIRHQMPDVQIIPHAVALSEPRMLLWWKEPQLIRFLITEYGKTILALLRTKLLPLLREASSGSDK